MLFRVYLTVPVSEFQHFVICNKEIWEKGDITDPLVLINDEESKFKSLQEDKLWVTNFLMKAKMLGLTTVIGDLTRQIDSKGKVKQSKKSFGNYTSSIVASGNNEKYDPPKPGEPPTKMFVKQLKTYCDKCNRRKGFWGCYEKKNHDDNYVPKPHNNAHKRENGGSLQLQLDDDIKKVLNTLTGGMGDATDVYEPDF